MNDMSSLGDGVCVGQVWRDNDPRERGVRTVEIIAILRGVHRNTGGTGDYAEVNVRRPGKKDRRSFIRIDRFNPNRQTGYSLVKEAS